MPLRLADPNHTKTIEVSGTKIAIRSLSVGETIKLRSLWGASSQMTDRQEMVDSIIAKMTARYGDMLDAIAPAVVSIDGYQDRPVRDVLHAMADIEEFMQIMTAVLEYSTLSWTESKNLSSSSAGSQPTPAGTKGSAVVTNATTEASDAAVSQEHEH